MKTIIATLTLLSATTLFAMPWFITEGDFTGKGVWTNAEGKNGTYESSMTFEQLSESRTKFGELAIQTTTRVSSDDEGDREMRNQSVWRFTSRTSFDIIRGEKVVGHGHCALKTCKLSFENSSVCGSKTLRYIPRKGIIKVKGSWCGEKTSGEYKGYLCKNCEE